MNVPFYTEILAHIKESIHSQRLALPQWEMNEGGASNGQSPTLHDRHWREFFVTQPWGGYDTTVWFRKTVALPEGYAGKPIVLVVDLPEGLLCLNGHPYQGVDQHHKEVLICKRAKRGEHFSFAIEAYSGRKKKQSCFNSAFIAVLNPEARALYHSFVALQELEIILGFESNEAARLRDIVRRTLDVFDAVLPESDEFAAVLGNASRFLHSTLEAEFTTTVPGIVHLIPQSHIDVVWLWTLRETKRKCARTFSTALRLMDEFPEFTFSQSQALLYEFTKENYPDIYQQIKKRVKEGRWHPIGAMWVEPDCNIPNGESLVRQILYGKKFFREEFGIDQNVLWLPDTFGYSWALPQILLKCDIQYFFTTKLTWNDTNTFPHNAFWWKGIDGSKVLAHIPSVGLEGQVTPTCLKKGWDAFQEKEQIQHTTQTFGYGDGGGGPTKQHVDSARVLNNVLRLPQSRLSTMEEFFRITEELADGLPTWNDELYLEMHRGTYTTQAWVKKENRQAEMNLYNTELLSVLALMHGKPSFTYPQEEIVRAWKLLLLNQFHDTVPGTAIKDAYEDVHADFDRIRNACKTLQVRALRAVVGKKTSVKKWSFVVVNTLNWNRSDYVTIEVKSDARAFSILTRDGKKIPHQIASRVKGIATLLCYVESMPPFSFTEIFVTPQANPQRNEPWDVSDKMVDSPYFRMEFDGRGQIQSLFDKTRQRELVKEGNWVNRFQTFKDTPPKWEAWEIDPEYEKKEFKLLEFVDAKVIERGPLRSVVRMKFKATSGSSLSQDITLYQHSHRIDFRTRVLWNEKQTMLKVAFPLRVKTDEAHYEIQFGALSHPTNPTSSRDKAKYEIPMQQWADLSGDGFGVSLLNDCKYGCDAKDTTLRMTLIRSPHYPHPIEPSWLHDDEPTDQGIHEFTYSLYPHDGDWRRGLSTHRARELNNPLITIEGELKRTLPTFLSLSHHNIIVDSVKKAEDLRAVIIRLHESHGVATETTVHFGVVPRTVEEGNLLEQSQRAFTIKDAQIKADFSPFEIKTLIATF